MAIAETAISAGDFDGIEEERARIARDLHDSVIQELFFAGLQLNQLKASTDDRSMTGCLDDVIDSLDLAVRRIRETIFSLNEGMPSGHELFDEVLAMCDRTEQVSGIRHRVSFRGDSENAIPVGLKRELTMALEELLSNVVFHSRASKVLVDVNVAKGSMVDVVVSDNGKGMTDDHPAPLRGNGLINVLKRTELLGGRSEVISSPTIRGTTVALHVPLVR